MRPADKPRAATPPCPPAIYICDGCGAEHHSPGTGIPVGWSTGFAGVRCGDCSVPLGKRSRR